MMRMNDLVTICDAVRLDLEERNAARDRAIGLSRQLIRICSESIRAIHRQDWELADGKLAQVKTGASELKAVVHGFPDLYYTGYTQDALKEVAEAFITNAIIRGGPLPSAKELDIESAAYLKGLGEAATELRRFILDIMRREDEHSAEAERLLKAMDDIYDQLVTFDFPRCTNAWLAAANGYRARRAGTDARRLDPKLAPAETARRAQEY